MNKLLIKKVALSAILFLLLTGCANTTQDITTKEQKTVKNSESTKVIQKKPESIQVTQKAKLTTNSKEEPKSSIIIIGEAEYVYLPRTKIKLKARIDTGATTTSINALNIKSFERDGKKWVKFELLDEKKKVYKRSLPIYEVIQVKRHGAEVQNRYVVKMRINLGTSSQLIRVSLTDRSKFTYPVLVGRNLLRGVAVVDVSKKYTSDPVKDVKWNQQVK